MLPTYLRGWENVTIVYYSLFDFGSIFECEGCTIPTTCSSHIAFKLLLKSHFVQMILIEAR